MDMPPSSPLSSHNSFAKQSEKFSASAELAKQAFFKRLAEYHGYSWSENECLLAIADAIFEGELHALQSAVQRLADLPRREQLVNWLAQEMRLPGVAILPLQLARWKFETHEESKTIYIMSIQLLNARRVLAVATDHRFRAHVYGPDRVRANSITHDMNEDPRILLKQISRLAASGTTSAPPPFYSGPRL